MKPTITYRPDIDGLRALAVLAVVLFHAYPRSILRGGFIGVDIFFVISGFLITSILISDLAQQRFSLARFYSHRIRRIFPALLLILTFCLVVGWFVLLGDEYQQLGKHIAGGAGFVSNFLFWQEAGYFDNSAETKPLLHLWSLGIEEQFYIFWPVLLWLIWKCKNYFWLLITGLALASFGWNIFHLHQYPTEVFYAPYTRFWELLIGSGLAYQSAYPSAVFKTLSSKCNITLKGHTLSDWMPNICSILGLVLILVGIFTIKQSSAFPGWYALLPTLGTAALIAGGPHSRVNKHIFSNRLLVGIGLISFPLYLWHWPLLSLSRIIEGTEVQDLVKLGLILLAILLAWLTYVVIEKPIRRGGNLIVKVALLTLAIIIIGTLGRIVTINKGFPKRDEDRSNFIKYFENSVPDFQFSKKKNLFFYYRSDCDFFDLNKLIAGVYSNIPKSTIDEKCYTRDSKYEKVVFIWGDSHAQQLNYGITKNIGGSWQIMQVASIGCSASTTKNDKAIPEYCQVSNKFALSTIKNTKPEVVIIAQRFGHNVQNAKVLDQHLKNVGVKSVVFIGPTVNWPTELPKVIAHKLWIRTPERTFVGVDKDILTFNKKLKYEFLQADLKYIDLIDLLCNSDGCLTRIGHDRLEDIVSPDTGHLLPIASDFVGKGIVGQVINP